MNALASAQDTYKGLVLVVFLFYGYRLARKRERRLAVTRWLRGGQR